VSNPGSKPLEDFQRQEDQRTAQLEEQLQSLQAEIQNLKSVMEDMRGYIKRLEEERERSLAYPHIEAVILDVLPNGNYVVKSSTGPNFLVVSSPELNKEQLKPGTRVALNQRGSTIVDVLPPSQDVFVRLMEVEERPNVSFSDVAGLDEQISLIREVVELPLQKPELFREMGIEPPKAVLLYGPPGCGKTLLARAVASETKATFISLVGTELVQKYVGEGARLTRELFELAKKKSPSIVFIDEIDAVAGKRVDASLSGEREVQRTMMQLLAEIDGFDPLGNVKIIGATNRVDILDPALLRPGRFDRLIEIPLPNKAGRREILQLYLRKVRAEGVDPGVVADMTEGMSGADLRDLVTEAGMTAIRNDRKVIASRDIMTALEVVKRRKQRMQDVGYIRRT